MKQKEDIYNRKWIIENAVEVLEEYSSGITIRQLHYRLVARGMINDTAHYKRVVSAMKVCRWDGRVSMRAFIDRERSVCGETEYEEKNLEEEIENGKNQIESWINYYSLNKWSNQPYYLEVWVEKKALQGVFEDPCMEADVALAPCKGYPSINFLNEAKERFLEAEDKDKKLIMIYFGDYDPSGEDIPRSIKNNLYKMGVDVELDQIALNAEQIEDMNLPGVPPKPGDSRTKNWGGGDVVECDAVEPKTLARMCETAIEKYFDMDLYMEMKDQETEEREQYQAELKVFVEELGNE